MFNFNFFSFVFIYNLFNLTQMLMFSLQSHLIETCHEVLFCLKTQVSNLSLYALRAHQIMHDHNYSTLMKIKVLLTMLASKTQS